MTEAAARPLLPRLARSLGLLVLVAVGMLTADFLTSYITLVAIVGGVVGYLLGIVLVAVALATAIAVTAKAIVGQPSIFGAICVTLLLAGLGGYGFVMGILTPLQFGGSLPLHLAVCGLCALSFGLFTGPWPLSVIGLAAGVGVVVMISLQPAHLILTGAGAVVGGAAERPGAASAL